MGITDNLKIKIINTGDFTKLSVTDQSYFESIRNSMLEIFPISNNVFDDISLNLAEQFAFKLLPVLNTMLDDKINAKFTIFQQLINTEITTLISATTAANTTASGANSGQNNNNTTK